MSEAPSSSAADTATAEHITHEEFRAGLPHGRFRLVVNPALARGFVSQRLHVVPVAVALIGCGMASALAGFTVAGLVLVGVGVLFRRAVQWQAPKLLLHLALQQPATYYAATTGGVMEVRRSAG